MFLYLQQQKFLKRSLDDTENVTDNYEPPHKLSHTNNENVKFSVEIVQQLEFTTSAANSQAQQISTNVTVKALTNASVKSDGSQHGNNNSGVILHSHANSQHDGNCVPNVNGQQTTSPASQTDLSNNLIECKQEPPSDFADLDQCAAALEKDVAANNHLPSLSELIGDDTIDNSDTFKDIPDFSDINNSDFLKMDIKTEDCKPDPLGLDSFNIKSTNTSHVSFGQPPQQQQQQLHQRGGYNTCNVPPNPMVSIIIIIIIRPQM